MDIRYLKNQTDPWYSFTGFNKISLGSIAGGGLKIFRWELWRAHLFACYGMDNVFLLSYHLQAQRLSGVGVHSFFCLKRCICSREPKLLWSVVAGGAVLVTGQWAWTVSSLWVRTGMPGWDRTEKYVLLNFVLLSLLLCGFRATRMAFPTYAFIHSSGEKKKVMYSGIAYMI